MNEVCVLQIILGSQIEWSFSLGLDCGVRFILEWLTGLTGHDYSCESTLNSHKHKVRRPKNYCIKWNGRKGQTLALNSYKHLAAIPQDMKRRGYFYEVFLNVLIIYIVHSPYSKIAVRSSYKVSQLCPSHCLSILHHKFCWRYDYAFLSQIDIINSNFLL